MEFAFLRRYLLPDDSFVTIVDSLFILEMHYKEELKILEKRFKERYGVKENWNEQIFEELDKEKTPLREKHTKTLSKAVAEALENIR